MLARLGAWMSFRTAAGLVEELFPLASGRSTSTVRRRVFAEAARVDAQHSTGRAEPAAAARSIDVGVHHLRAELRGRRASPPRSVDRDRNGGRRPEPAPRGRHRHPRSATRADRRRSPAAGPGQPIRPSRPTLTVPKCCAAGSQRPVSRGGRSLTGRIWRGGCRPRRRRTRACRFSPDASIARPAIPARRMRTAVNNLRDYVDGQSAYLVDYAGGTSRCGRRAVEPIGSAAPNRGGPHLEVPPSTGDCSKRGESHRLGVAVGYPQCRALMAATRTVTTAWALHRGSADMTALAARPPCSDQSRGGAGLGESRGQGARDRERLCGPATSTAACARSSPVGIPAWPSLRRISP